MAAGSMSSSTSRPRSTPIRSGIGHPDHIHALCPQPLADGSGSRHPRRGRGTGDMLASQIVWTQTIRAGAGVAEVSGFFYPRTATGRSSLLPPPPWHYSGDLLTVEYRTDPARVAGAAARPAPARPGGPRRGRADLGRLAVLRRRRGRAAGPGAGPVPGVLRRGPMRIRQGRVYSRCVYIWVDADFALARGLHPGIPEEARVDPPDESPPVRPGRAQDRARAAPLPGPWPPPTAGWPRRW